MKFKTGDYVGVSIVTVGALVLMFTIGAGSGSWSFGTSNAVATGERPIPKVPVSVVEAAPEPVEIMLRYAGMIRPLERYSLAFEIGGRVEALALNPQGNPLNIGDRVEAGQVVAQLDSRLLRARLKRAKAVLEKAQADLARTEDLRSRSPGTVTEAQYIDHVTMLVEAEAEVESAEKSLDDAILRSPVSGVVSQRLIKVGESVNMHQPVLEVLEVDELVLVAGVPESRIQEINVGQKAHIELLARDLYGRPRPPIDGYVYRVAEAADQQTGLFEVEVRLPNDDGSLKPGLIARANIVVREIVGFRLPASAAVFRDHELFLFTVGPDGRAHRYTLHTALEQGSELILTELPESYRTVVVRGQHRLVEGREVEILELDGDEPSMDEPDVSVAGAVSGE